MQQPRGQEAGGERVPRAGGVHDLHPLGRSTRRDETLLAGADDVRAAAATLGDTYRAVVVTLGRDRAPWQQGFIAASAPAERVEVVDTTGAGDSFAAGFLASWLLHPEPETALAAGNRVAASAVTRVGARP